MEIAGTVGDEAISVKGRAQIVTRYVRSRPAVDPLHSGICRPTQKAAYGNGSGAAWNLRMTIMLGLGLAASLLLMPYDAWIVAQVRLLETSQSTAMQTLTRFGLSQWYLVTAGLVFLVAGALDWRKHDNHSRSRLALFFGQAAYAFTSVAISGLMTNVFKIIIGRARPRLFDQFGSLHFQPFTAGYDYASYPSGHSTTAGAVTMILMLWFPRFRWAILAGGLIVAGTRIMVGAHYASDVVAGFSVGLLTALFIARWLARKSLVFRTDRQTTLAVPRYLKLTKRQPSRSR